MSCQEYVRALHEAALVHIPGGHNLLSHHGYRFLHVAALTQWQAEELVASRSTTELYTKRPWLKDGGH